MTKVETAKIKKLTDSHQDWLINQLKNKKKARAYLQVALEEYQNDHDKAVFMLALKNVALAQGGIAHLAHATDLNREHLYRLLSGKGNPTLDTLSAILRTFGMRIKVALA